MPVVRNGPPTLLARLDANTQDIRQCSLEYARLRTVRNALMVSLYARWLDEKVLSDRAGVTELSTRTGLSRVAIYAVVSSRGSAEARAAAVLERHGQTRLPA